MGRKRKKVKRENGEKYKDGERERQIKLEKIQREIERERGGIERAKRKREKERGYVRKEKR